MEAYLKIKQAREILGLNQSEFATAIGTTQKDVSLIESGNKKFIPNKYIEFLIEKGFDINSLFDFSESIEKLHDNIVDQSKITYNHTKTDRIILEQKIPLYELEAVAGVLPILQELQSQIPRDYLYIPNAPRCDGAIYATGDSMYPRLKSGDILGFKIIEDFIHDVYWGEMYILYIEMGGDVFRTVKYVHKGENDKYFKLVSENRHHQDKEVRIDKIRAMAHVKFTIRLN